MPLFGTRPPQTEFIDSVTGDEMMSLLAKTGFVPDLSEDQQGDPLIRFQVEGTRSLVIFYNPLGEGRFGTFQYYAGYQDRYSLEKVNEFNRTKRFVRAFNDPDETISLLWDVTLEGGVRADFLEQSVLRWRGALRIFNSFF